MAFTFSLAFLQRSKWLITGRDLQQRKKHQHRLLWLWCSANGAVQWNCAAATVQLCVELRINCATLTAPAHILHQLQLIMECEEMCKKIWNSCFTFLGSVLLPSITTSNVRSRAVQLLSPDPRCCRPYMLVGAVSCCQQLMPGAVVSSCCQQQAGLSRHNMSATASCASIVTASPLHHACPALNEPGTSISNPGHWALLKEIANSVLIQS